MKKLKKVAKIEKVFGKPDENLVFEEKQKDNIEVEPYDVLSEYETEEDTETQIEKTDSALTKKQIEKQSKIENVKSKISKILKSSNIEIVDENFGDEYDLEEDDNQLKSQQDYDTLKALFGDKDRNKKDELTLTIDDFDYTYVGKYIEEFDLMHLKNIKHIKLRNPHAKKIKKALIAAGLTVTIALGGVLGFFLMRKTPVVMTSVALSQELSTSNYYTNDYFSYDGLFINVKYSDGSSKKVKVTSEHFEYTEGSVEVIDDNIQFLGGNVLVVFNYEGYLLNYNIEVKTKQLRGIDAVYSDSIFNLNAGDYIKGFQNKQSDLVLLFDYGEYGYSKEGRYSNVSLKIGETIVDYESGKGWKLPESLQNKTITIIYNDNAGQTYSVSITK